jgi:hypothetical protein
MITQEITINGNTYTVSASTRQGLEAAIGYLTKSVEQFEAQGVTELKEKQEDYKTDIGFMSWEDSDTDVQEEPKKKRKKSE